MMLPGDGDYVGDKAEHWKRIGRAVFGDRPHTPVMLHPNGWSDPYDAFAGESWLDLMGYQSSHSSSHEHMGWLLRGAPTRSWATLPPRPVINLEPAYENHIDLADMSSRWAASSVRKLLYWSLLIAPTAGVTYGGHGVWEWSDGKRPPAAHDHAGIPLPWRGALEMPAAEQIVHLANCFASLDWWALRPAPQMIVDQPGDGDICQTIMASRSERGDLAIIYIPQGQRVTLNLEKLETDLSAFWLNPRTGSRLPATYPDDQEVCEFETPDTEDWVLIFQSRISIPIDRLS